MRNEHDPFEEPKPRRGRPSKLTPQLIERLAMCFRVGMSARNACAQVGIDQATLSRWLARGKWARSGLYSELYEAIAKAEADAELSAAASLYSAVPKSWRAARSVLRERYKDWGRSPLETPEESEKREPRSQQEVTHDFYARM